MTRGLFCFLNNTPASNMIFWTKKRCIGKWHRKEKEEKVYVRRYKPRQKAARSEEGPLRACWEDGWPGACRDRELTQGMLGRVPGPLSAPVGGEVPSRRWPTVQWVRHPADLIKSSLHQSLPVKRGTHVQIPRRRRRLCPRFGNSSPSPKPSCRVWELRRVKGISPSVTIRYSFFRDYFTFQYISFIRSETV